MQLVLVDAIGIQRYIFKSNKLRDIVGASALLDAATTEWVEDELKQLWSDLPGAVSTPDNGASIFSDDCVQAEIVYSGGGNVLLVLREEEDARQFKLNYQRRLLLDAPALSVEVVIYPMKTTFAQGLREAQKKLQQAKTMHVPLDAALAMGVTEVCSITGSVANDLVKSGDAESRVSADIATRRENALQNRVFKLLKRELKENLMDVFELPKEMEDMGREEGDKSYLGIVHIDGNGIGQKKIDLMGRIKEMDPKEAVRELRKFSEYINSIVKGAFLGSVERLIGAVKYDEKGNPMVADTVHLAKVDRQAGKWFLPLRPLVTTGDDVTFICDGRIALDLAAEWVRLFEVQSHGEITACAGVAIVKTNYPFSKAYDYAEHLCQEAKKNVRAKRDAGGSKRMESAITWGVVHGGLASENLFDYDKGQWNQTLSMRPYVVHSEPDRRDVGSWSWLRNEIWADLKEFGGDDRQGRNQLKRLLHTFYEGKEAVETHIKRMRSLGMPIGRADVDQSDALRSLSWKDPWNTGGTAATPYVDLLEVLDLLPTNPDWLGVMA